VFARWLWLCLLCCAKSEWEIVIFRTNINDNLPIKVLQILMYKIQLYSNLSLFGGVSAQVGAGGELACIGDAASFPTAAMLGGVTRGGALLQLVGK